MTFLVGDRVWVKDDRNNVRHKGVVERIWEAKHQLTIQIDDGPKLRVYVGVVTLRETHE